MAKTDTPPTPGTAAPAAKKGSGLYAQRNILHGAEVIVRGTELPADFDAKLLKALEERGDIAQNPPPERKAK